MEPGARSREGTPGRENSKGKGPELGQGRRAGAEGVGPEGWR